MVRIMEEKIYLKPGDLVQLKQDLPYKPTMIVVKKEVSIFKNRNGEDNSLRGIKCRWFTSDGILQEAVYNTKDLQLVKSNNTIK